MSSEAHLLNCLPQLLDHLLERGLVRIRDMRETGFGVVLPSHHREVPRQPVELSEGRVVGAVGIPVAEDAILRELGLTGEN